MTSRLYSLRNRLITDILSLGIGLVAGDSIEASMKSGSVIHMNIFGTEST